MLRFANFSQAETTEISVSNGAAKFKQIIDGSVIKWLEKVIKHSDW